MKKEISAIVKKVVKGIAVISSETTSMFGLYQPQTPKSLIKTDKRKVK